MTPADVASRGITDAESPAPCGAFCWRRFTDAKASARQQTARPGLFASPARTIPCAKRFAPVRRLNAPFSILSGAEKKHDAWLSCAANLP